MDERNIKQIDILNLCKPYCDKYSVKMNKSDISQYVSGKIEPSQNKLVVLSMALGVSEAWLMGYDVPKERKYVSVSNCFELSELEKQLVVNFRKADEFDKTTVLRTLGLDRSLTEAMVGTKDKLA